MVGDGFTLVTRWESLISNLKSLLVNITLLGARSDRHPGGFPRTEADDDTLELVL
jgi:hypothetical protein